MKKTALVLAAILFSLLFYHQGGGLNFFLFSIVVIGVLIYFNPNKFKATKVKLVAGIYALMSFFVFFYHSDLAIFSSIISLVLLIGAIASHNASLYIQFFNGLYSSVAGSFTSYFNKTKSDTPKELKNFDLFYWVKIIFIPFFIIVLFVLLYRNINPVFADLVDKIDLSFINLGWLLFTGLGYFFFNNISKPHVVEPATQNDLNTDNILRDDLNKKVSKDKINKENQLGVVLFVLLNSLLILLIVTDIIYLNQQGNEVSSVELKSQLHQSVNSLITSIILAISIIVYFFRGKLNFFKKNTLLKNTTFLWITLNIIIALLTAYKNYQYITSYGITYKRIGVYVYLLLALSGLFFTFLKVKEIRNISYLFRTNIQVAFVVLILSSMINWDILITKMNIKNKHLSAYTISLSNKNAFLLKDYLEQNNDMLSEENKSLIITKYNEYVMYLETNTWQETIYDNFSKQEN